MYVLIGGDRMEITANAIQTVNSHQDVLFSDIVSGCSTGCMYHRKGSGLVSLKGTTQQKRARFRVSFNGNVAVPATETVGPISLAIAVDGEAISFGTMIATPAAVSEYQNVSATIMVDVPRNCCETISVKNIDNEPISIQNANLVIERVA